MSLEQEIQKNTAALVALTAAFLAVASTAASLGANAAPRPEAPVSPAAAPTPPAAKTEAAPPVTDADKPLEYKDVAAVVTAFVKAKGKPAALALLAPFAPTGKLGDAKPADWAAIVAAVKAAS